MKVDAFLKVFDADHSGELDFAEFVKVPENTFPSKKNNLNEMFFSSFFIANEWNVQLWRVWRCSQWRMLRERGSWDSSLTSTTSTEMVSFATVSSTRWDDDHYDDSLTIVQGEMMIMILQFFFTFRFWKWWWGQIWRRTSSSRLWTRQYFRWEQVITHT